MCSFIVIKKEAIVPQLIIEITPHGEEEYLATVRSRNEHTFGHSPSAALRELTMLYPNLFSPGTTVHINIQPDHRPGRNDE